MMLFQHTARANPRFAAAAAAALRAPAPRVVQQQHQQRRARAGAGAAALGGTAPAALPPWEVRMLYDGACPLCMKEVDFLRRRDTGKIDFVDIAAPGYSAADNYGISYEQVGRAGHGGAGAA
jgi:hypothetical protein